MRARRATQRSAHPICTRSTEISARNQSVHFVFVQLGHGSFRLDNQKETIFAFSYSISLGACTCRARRRHAGLCKLSEERRVGTELVITCKSRLEPNHS